MGPMDRFNAPIDGYVRVEYDDAPADPRHPGCLEPEWLKKCVVTDAELVLAAELRVALRAYVDGVKQAATALGVAGPGAYYMHVKELLFSASGAVRQWTHADVKAKVGDAQLDAAFEAERGHKARPGQPTTILGSFSQGGHVLSVWARARRAPRARASRAPHALSARARVA